MGADGVGEVAGDTESSKLLMGQDLGPLPAPGAGTGAELGVADAP